MATKSIYEFFVNKKVKKEITEDTEQGKLTKTVEEEVPVKIVLQQPSRAESEEASMVYALEYGNGVRKGLLTNALIERTYDKDGYIKEQQEKALGISRKLLELQNEFTLLKAKQEVSDEDSVRLKELEDEWYSNQTNLQNIKNSMQGMYNSTAETFADQKAMLWKTVFLTYVEDGGNLKPFFKGDGDTFEDKFKKKLNHFDALAALDDPFTNMVIDKAGLYTSLWHLGKASTKKDFDTIEKGLNGEEEIVEDEEDEVESKDEKIEEVSVETEGKYIPGDFVKKKVKKEKKEKEEVSVT